MLRSSPTRRTSQSKPTSSTSPRRQNHPARDAPRSAASSSSSSSSSRTRQQQQQGQPRSGGGGEPAKRRPYQAGFYTSLQSQKLIKDAAYPKTKNRGRQQRPAVQRAALVLDTFLSIPAHRCNAANLVCALTLSAKVMMMKNSRPAHGSSSSADIRHLRSSLYQTVDVLYSLLLQDDATEKDDGDVTTTNNNNNNSQKKKNGCALSARQLCNAVWAIAKHADRDDGFLPVLQQAQSSPASVTTIMDETMTTTTTSSPVLVPNKSLSDSSGRMNRAAAVVGLTAETWDLRNDRQPSSSLSSSWDSLSPSQRVDATVDEVARQLTAILEQDSGIAKEGELCMASWAYGVLRKRQRPPGWKQEPRLGALSQPQQQQQERSDDNADDDSAAFLPAKNGRSRPGRSRPRPVVGAEDGMDVIRFEQWNTDTAIEEEDYRVPSSATDILFDKIAETLLGPLEGMDPKNSFGNVPPLRIQKCRWSELANLAWAFATHGSSCSQFSQELMQEVAYEATRRLQEGRAGEEEGPLSRDIAQIVWSLGTLQADNYKLADGLVEFVDAVSSEWIPDVATTASSRPLWDWSCPDLVQVALSLAHARLDDQPLLRAIYQEASRRLTSNFRTGGQQQQQQHRQSFLAWEISILLWSQARLYLTGEQGDVFSVFGKKAVRAIHAALDSGRSMESLGIGPQEEANIAWSLTVLELYRHSSEARDLLQAIFTDTVRACEANGVIQLEHAHQLWQALFVLDGECPECIAQVPEWFHDDLREKWVLEKSRTKISSARHKSLSSLLDLMGVKHYNEHDEDIDVAIVLKPQASWTHETESNLHNEVKSASGLKVAVEFDGPNHFTRRALLDCDPSKPPRALGHTVFKYRLLKRQGWNVVRVPYYEFDRIPFWASMERQRYLQRLLKTHCNLRFSLKDISEYQPPTRNKRSRFE